MYRKSARRSSLFLLELMISILMFSVASAWCVRLFVTARSVVKETEEQNRAQNLVAGYAELFLASEDFDAFLLNEGAEKPDALPSGDRTMTEVGEGEVFYRLRYDESWKACGEEDACFVFEIRMAEEENFTKCHFWFGRPVRGNSTIYSLDVEKYTGGEATL